MVYDAIAARMWKSPLDVALAMDPVSHTFNLPTIFTTNRAEYTFEVDGVTDGHTRLQHRLSRKVACGVFIMLSYIMTSKPWLADQNVPFTIDWISIYGKWDFITMKPPFAQFETLLADEDVPVRKGASRRRKVRDDKEQTGGMEGAAIGGPNVELDFDVVQPVVALP